MYAARLVYIDALAALGVIYGALFPVNRMSAEAGLLYKSARVREKIEAAGAELPLPALSGEDRSASQPACASD